MFIQQRDFPMMQTTRHVRPQSGSDGLFVASDGQSSNHSQTLMSDVQKSTLSECLLRFR